MRPRTLRAPGGPRVRFHTFRDRRLLGSARVPISVLGEYCRKKQTIHVHDLSSPQNQAQLPLPLRREPGLLILQHGKTQPDTSRADELTYNFHIAMRYELEKK